MQDDPALDRIREIRHQISQQFDHDPKKLVEHYIQLQERHKDRLLQMTQDKETEAAPPQA